MSPGKIASQTFGAVGAWGRIVGFVISLFPMLPSRPVNWLTRRPLEESVTYPTVSGVTVGVIYRPSGSGRHPGMVICLGVVPAEFDHPQVARLGNALARSGFVALMVWSPAMRDMRIEPEDTKNVAIAFDWLTGQPYVDPDRSGLLGACVGGAFALMAAADARIRDRVRFVAAYAPYSSMWTLAQDAASSTTIRSTEREPWEVDQLTRKVFIRTLTATLEPGEAALLTRAFTDADVKFDVKGLSESGRIVFDLLSHPSPVEAALALERLPVAMQERLSAMSPLEFLSDIHAPLISVLHDEGDEVIPVGESRRLIAALSDYPRVCYTEMKFQHMNPAHVPVCRLTREFCKFALAMYPIFRQ
jgi:dienelactone hydrolase